MATSVEQKPARVRPAWIGGVRDRLSIWGVVAWFAPFAAALAAYVVAYEVMEPGTTGDEPHYLLVAESIAFDGDLDLRNDYASRERTLRVVNVFPLGWNLQAAEYKESGELRPLHGVGLPALLAPAVGLGGLTGARLMMVLIAALLAHQLYRLLADLGLRRLYRIAAWIAVALCLPVLPFSSQIYPELPGALLVVVVLRILLRAPPPPAALAFGSLASAALFWLHVRYFPISLALLLGLAYAATSEPRGPRAGAGGLRERLRLIGPELRRRAKVAKTHLRAVTLPVLVPYGVVLGLFILAFQHWYGSPDPRTPYYAYSTTTLGGGGWRALYDYILHDLFNPLVGWIPFAPVHWLGLAALGCLIVWFGWPAVAGLAVAVGYELILASAAPAGGWGLPARYLLIVIPLVAIPIALVIQQVRLARIVFIPLLAGSLVFAVAAVRNYQGLYPAGETQKIFGLRSIAPAFPVTLPPLPATSFTVTPKGPPVPQTGRLERGEVVARPGRDAPGFLRFGPYVALKHGAYNASFSLAASGARPDEQVAVIEAVGGGEVVFAREAVTAGQLRRRRNDIRLTFATPGDYAIETRVYYIGRGTVRAGPIRVEPIVAAAGPPARLRAWPLAFLWIAGTVVIGALLVQVMQARRPASVP
jgi:hypothetical protein